MLKRYSLRCPNCNEEEVIYLPADSPETPFCKNCDEDVDLESLCEFIDSWTDYLADRKALLEQESKEVTKS